MFNFKVNRLHTKRSFLLVILLQELQEKLSRLDEDAVVTKAMRSHVTQFPELEKQNKKLKEEIQSYR